MFFNVKDAMIRTYGSYRFMKQFEKKMSAKDYGMMIQGKRKKKKRGEKNR